LAAAAFPGYHEIVLYLIKSLGANVNSPDSLGQTPLYVAASMDHLAVVQVLLKLEADIKQRSNDGSTPLVVASALKHQEVVKWLV
jgi:ankyrin repeat protein